MKVSVIIPFHREWNYLADCLESLDEQTCQNFQVILICDFQEQDAMDKLSDMVKMHQKYMIRVEYLTDTSGVAAARNRGLALAQGEYIYFLDADDYIERNVMEAIKKADQDVVYGTTHNTWYKRQVYYENGQELDEKNSIQHNVFQGNPKKLIKYMIQRNEMPTTNSVLSMFIKRSMINRYEITFDESFRYMSDLPFLAEILKVAATSKFVEDATYIKRKHNDPINMPALSQEKDSYMQLMEAVASYKKARTIAGEAGKICRELDMQFVLYLAAKGGESFIGQKTAERKQLYRNIQKATQDIPADTMKGCPRFTRKLMRVVRKGNVDKFTKTLSRRGSLRTLKKVLTSRAQCKKYCYFRFFSKKPMLENTVLLESFFGKNYSDSPKYIFEYLNETYPGKYKYVWIMNQKKKLPYPAKQIKRFSFRYFYYLGRCKYIVFNSRQPDYFVKRKGNVFLETWHGTPLKKLVFDMEEVTTASPLYKQQFYTQTRSWDYLVSPNAFCSEIFRHAFMYDGPLLEYGYPRNDILHKSNKEEIAEKLKERLSIPKDKKVILYAPTWRDDEFYGSGKYKFSLQLNLAKLKKELGDEYVVILRTHYFIADYLDVSEYEGFVYNLSKYDDIAELYLISDLLITDYSSVFFDYANLCRPMLFFTYDYEKYRDVLRGFYMNMEEEIPGPLLYTTDEVIDAIKHIENVTEEYKIKYKEFYDKYCAWEDGHAAENIVREVF